MNEENRDIKPIYRALSVVLSVFFTLGLIAELFFSKNISWSFILSCSVTLTIFVPVVVNGKVPKLFGFLSRL
jgi:hypothetical protein